MPGDAHSLALIPRQCWAIRKIIWKHVQKADVCISLLNFLYLPSYILTLKMTVTETALPLCSALLGAHPGSPYVRLPITALVPSLLTLAPYSLLTVLGT